MAATAEPVARTIRLAQRNSKPKRHDRVRSPVDDHSRIATTCISRPVVASRGIPLTRCTARVVALASWLELELSKKLLARFLGPFVTRKRRDHSAAVHAVRGQRF